MSTSGCPLPLSAFHRVGVRRGRWSTSPRRHQMRTRSSGSSQRPSCSTGAERRVELVEVAHDVGAELRRAVRVDGEVLLLLLLAALGAPAVGPVGEQPLAVVGGHLAAVGRAGDGVGLVGDRQPAQVADVLPDGERAVDVLAGQRAWLEGVVLRDEGLGLHLEGGLVVGGPPVVEVAGAVVLRPLVVEAVADLVADHGADPAVVLGRVGVRGEERLLQDAGGEADLVGAGVVVGVDGLRQHQPLVGVERRPDLGQLAGGLERRRGGDVAHELAGVELQLRVVAELVGVADLGPEGVELLVGPLLGVVAHPVEGGDRAPVGLQQVGDQVVHQRLGVRREVSLDVLLAERLTHRALDQRHPALPPGPQLGRAVEGAAVEVEVGVRRTRRSGTAPRRGQLERSPRSASPRWGFPRGPSRGGRGTTAGGRRSLRPWRRTPPRLRTQAPHSKAGHSSVSSEKVIRL